MQIVPDDVLKRQQSAAWIDPEGKLMLLDKNELHDNLAVSFPGMPDPESSWLARDFPSTYAVANLRYVKVSSPFQCAWDGGQSARDGRSMRRRSDIRMETMADLMSQAAVMIKRSRYNPWGFSSESDLTQIPVYVVKVEIKKEDPDDFPSQKTSDTTVGDFIKEWGSREASDHLYKNLLSERAWQLLQLLESRGDFDFRHRKIICEELARRSIL